MRTQPTLPGRSATDPTAQSVHAAIRSRRPVTSPWSHADPSGTSALLPDAVVHASDGRKVDTADTRAVPIDVDVRLDRVEVEVGNHAFVARSER